MKKTALFSAIGLQPCFQLLLLQITQPVNGNKPNSRVPTYDKSHH